MISRRCGAYPGEPSITACVLFWQVEKDMSEQLRSALAAAQRDLQSEMERAAQEAEQQRETWMSRVRAKHPHLRDACFVELHDMLIPGQRTACSISKVRILAGRSRQ